jgi:hypothetical protein
MPNFQLGDSEKAPFALTELDAASQPASAQLGDSVSVVSDSPSNASIVMDPTPAPGSIASGFVVGGTPKTGVNITATVTHADGTKLSVSDVIDVVGGVASSLSLGLGAPVSQGPAPTA